MRRNLRWTPESLAAARQLAARQQATPRVREADIQRAILAALQLHPRVAWIARMNVGVMRRPNADGSERAVKFGFPGLADLVGQLVDGRLLALECKRADGQLTGDQRAFLSRVAGNGGVAAVVRSVGDALAAIERAGARRAA